MENRNKSEKTVADADERFARIEAYLAKLEQKTDDHRSNFENSMKEMIKLFAELMPTIRHCLADETRLNRPHRDIPTYIDVEGPPVFDGLDPIGWIIRANIYFEVLLTPEKDKVRCAIGFMESSVARWVNFMLLTPFYVSWAQLCRALVERHDGKFKGDAIERICSTKQTGHVEAYISDFLGIITQLPGLPDSYYVGFFLNGLRPEIRDSLRILRPTKLQHAIGFARVDEDRIVERSAKKSRIEDEHDHCVRVRGRIGDEEVIVLITSGSSYSCVSSSVANRLGLERSDSSRFVARVGGFHAVSTKGICRHVRLGLGKCCFDVDLFVLDMGLADVILGGDWLRRLGRVEMFRAKSGLCMGFDWGGARHRLSSERGLMNDGPWWGSIILFKRENGSYVWYGPEIKYYVIKGLTK